MAEALGLLPVLAVLLLSVPLLRELYAARQRALGAARSCGFAYALGGCSKVPDGCASPRREAAPIPAAESNVVAIARETSGGDFGVFDELPLLGDALRALLGETIEARSAVAVRRGGVERSVQGAISLVCNEQPRDVLSIARAVFCRRLPLLDCGGGP